MNRQTPAPAHPSVVQRLVQKIVALRPISWLLGHVLHRLDKPVLKLTGNRRSLTALLAGVPVVVLKSYGARSGLPRYTPLVGIPDGEGFILVASSFGRKRNPGWYYNLRAHPEVELAVNGQASPYCAREASGEARSRAWRLALDTYAGFAAYARRTGGREIPVFILTPSGRGADAGPG